MTHNCPDCGIEHGEPVIEEPIIVDEQPVADASVEIARIEADRDVTIAKVGAGVERGWQDQKLVELEAKMAGMADALAAMAPPAPEPVPVVVDEPPAEPAITEPVVAAPEPVEPAPPKPKRGNAFWR